MSSSAAASTKSDVARRFHAMREQTERLAAPLSPEDQTVQSMPDTSPTKWHRAHVTWFFETFLLAELDPNYIAHDEQYAFLFNSYYVQAGERHPRPFRGMITRPSAEEVGVYRAAVDTAVDALIAAADDDLLQRIAQIVDLGINHEQQHQELLLMDIKHVLSLNPTEPAYTDEPHELVVNPGPVEWIEFGSTTTQTGLPTDHDGFAFDNEYPQHDQLIRPFALADRLVTAGEWLAFMADDGYHRPELWMSDGWYKRVGEGWESPLYWSTSNQGWRIHTLTGARPVDPNEPVCHVSFYEADAYARWSGARLATEFEWEHAAATHNVVPDTDHRVHMHPRAAGVAPGLKQMFGEAWQWTESAYRPYPGYVVPDGAIGEYNGKFMINTMVLRGSCAYTPTGHARPTYRNFFHPHTRWHLSGVRLAKDL